eukprot:TRINITY_DN1772_c0_g1_i6.p1 TRINITY_DN1772_c0_g1~~TRINITY_DN1772_c0_g1_i6.p1  ORF type:complete len:118 (-),score=16.89 TRINITY_DN1772_c0_g1_i6:195-548(-)
MVKKNNDNVRNLDVDTFSRIHFLIQASYLMKEKLPHLSRFYANTALGISQKLVVRLHPGLKELVCARCGSFTLPGEARSEPPAPNRVMWLLQVVEKKGCDQETSCPSSRNSCYFSCS